MRCVGVSREAQHVVVFARCFSTAQTSDTSGQTLFSQTRRTEGAEKKKEKSFFTFTERHGKLRGVCRSFVEDAVGTG